MARVWDTDSPNTVWTDGSRPDSGDMGAACASSSAGEWVGQVFYLGHNKEVFDAETFAIYQALRILDRQQATGQQYTIFSDSQAAIQRIRTDMLGSDQQWARAAMEVHARLTARGNEVTIRWVPAHSGVMGNEMADGFAREAAGSRRSQQHRVPDGLLQEASLSHLARVATENRSRVTARWISDHVRPE